MPSTLHGRYKAVGLGRKTARVGVGVGVGTSWMWGANVGTELDLHHEGHLNNDRHADTSDVGWAVGLELGMPSRSQRDVRARSLVLR